MTTATLAKEERLATRIAPEAKDVLPKVLLRALQPAVGSSSRDAT
jgi:hypothetical protein